MADQPADDFIDNVDQGAERIFGLLSSEDPDDGATEDGDGSAEDRIEGLLADDAEFADEEEEEEEQDPDDEGAEDDDPVEPDADGDEVDEEDEDEPGDADAPQTFTVKVDGKEVTVTLDEALAGYQRQEAFTRKTQELAEQRRALEGESAEVRQARQQYEAALQQAAMLIKAQMPQEPDWDKLQKESPAKYARELADYQARQKQLQAVFAEQQRVQQQAQADEQAQRAKLVAHEQEALVSAVPEWVDDDRRSEETERLVQYAQTTYGWTPDELADIVDHRPVVILRKAMLYDEAQKKGDEVRRTTKKKDTAPTLKPGNRNTSKPKPGKKQAEKAKSRLRQSGSVGDAAEALFNIGVLDS